MITAVTVILGAVLVALLGSWAYFTRWQVSRPPVGVFNGRDIALMIGGILLIPYLYLLLPVPVVGALLALGTASVLYALVEPVVPSKALRWAIIGALLAGDWAASAVWGAATPGYLAVNNVVILLLVIGTVNLWAGSGMSARAAAVLGGVLMVYDFTATSLFPLMGQLILRLAGLPLSPIVGWLTGGSAALIGLGDLLLAAVFPLILRRTYSETAGRLALALNALALLAIFIIPFDRLAPLLVGQGLFPVMALLGPLMIAQYAYWQRRCGAGRPTWQYRQALSAKAHPTTGFGS